MVDFKKFKQKTASDGGFLLEVFLFWGGQTLREYYFLWLS